MTKLETGRKLLADIEKYRQHRDCADKAMRDAQEAFRVHMGDCQHREAEVKQRSWLYDLAECQNCGAMIDV